MSSAPTSGDIVHLRTRHDVVEGASPGPHGTVVDLACMDDDSQGSRLSAIWELELDGEIITRQAWESIGSNSFSALLVLLDPQRFTRGVPVTKENLEKVMVRRLKEDIRQIAGGFPKRLIVQEDITGLPENAPELELSRLLDEYAFVCSMKCGPSPKLAAPSKPAATRPVRCAAKRLSEPARIAEFYDVKTTRIEPVGIVYLWPA